MFLFGQHLGLQGEATFLVDFAQLCCHFYQHAFIHVDKVSLDPHGCLDSLYDMLSADCSSLTSGHEKRCNAQLPLVAASPKHKIGSRSCRSEAGHTLDGTPAGVALSWTRYVVVWILVSCLAGHAKGESHQNLEGDSTNQFKTLDSTNLQGPVILLRRGVDDESREVRALANAD